MEDPGLSRAQSGWSLLIGEKASAEKGDELEMTISHPLHTGG